MTTVVIRPSGNVNALWDTNTFANIDDNVLQPSIGDGLDDLQLGSDAGEEQIWFLSGLNIPGGTLTDLIVYTYGLADNANDIHASGRAYFNGTPTTTWERFDFLTTGDAWDSGIWTGLSQSTENLVIAFGLDGSKTPSFSVGKSTSLNLDVVYAEAIYSVTTPPPTPSSTTYAFYNDFVSNFGISSGSVQHTQILELFKVIRPSGNIMYGDPEVDTTSSDTSYLYTKIPNVPSGKVIDRVSFRPTDLGPSFRHLGPGLQLEMRVDNITANPSGCDLNVWLDYQGKGYNDDNRSWVKFTTNLASGLNQYVDLSGILFNEIGVGDRFEGSQVDYNSGTMTVQVTYDHQANYYNEFRIYSMRMAGFGWFENVDYSGEIPLFVSGHIPNSGYIPLYINAYGIESGTIPLYLQGNIPDSGFIPLYLKSAIESSGNIPLYIFGGLSASMPLFLKGIEPASGHNSIPLFMDATPAGVSGLFGKTNLYIFGQSEPSGSLNLFIGGWQNPIESTSNMNLFLKAFGNSSGTAMPIDKGLSLFLANNNIDNSGIIPLYLEGAATVPYSGNMNLFIARGNDSVDKSMPMYIAGPSGYTDSMPLFLEGQPNYRDNIDLYINGIGVESGLFKLYIHGF